MNKTYTNREIEIILIRNNFVVVRNHGGHCIYMRGKVSISIVMGHDMNPMIWKRLCKENGIDCKVLDKKYWKKMRQR